MTDYEVRELSALLGDAELGAIRAQLPAVESVAYLNAGTLGPLPIEAIEAMAREHDYDAAQRQTATHWERVAGAQAAARGALTSLTGVGADQVSLMHTTHEGINTALWGLPTGSGDNVVTLDEEHPGVLVPLGHVARRGGLDVRVAAWGDDDGAFLDAVLSRVDERTRALVVSHVSWVSGRVAPLNGLRQALPASCRIIVDGAQAAGVLPVDPTDGWDAYTVSGQKWPCGPSGSCGLALVDPEAWLPTFGAYLQSTAPLNGLTAPLVADGRRFETSQEATAPLVGFAASVEWLVTKVGTWRVAAHARALNEQFRRALGDAAVTVVGDVHLACVDLGRPAAVEVVARLAAEGFGIRALSDSRVRVSLGCWNTVDEVTGCAALMAEAVSERR
ncbi:MAG: aminotransferase class V-fold PLP-dependent enzyme [Thermoleophilia bacterium]|nr:aminotransferase class V-fold PLP-dependent enzyme [Thermoleophilia bacterium]